MEQYRDFIKEPRSAYRFDVWKRCERISTPLGSYECDLILDFDAMPDEEMISSVREVSAFLEENHQLVATILEAHLHRSKTESAELFEDSEDTDKFELPPEGATGQQLFETYGGGTVSISRDKYEDNRLKILVGFDVTSDPEHGLIIEYSSGGFTKINDSDYSIVDGLLKYEWDQNMRMDNLPISIEQIEVELKEMWAKKEAELLAKKEAVLKRERDLAEAVRMFSAMNYKKVIELLSPYIDTLTKLEYGKLKYAQKKVSMED